MIFSNLVHSFELFSSTMRRSLTSWWSAPALLCIGFVLLGQNRHYHPSRRERMVYRALLVLFGLIFVLLIYAR